MENNKINLPTDINKEALGLIATVSGSVNSIAEGWKVLTDLIKEKDEKIKELEDKLIEDAKELN